MTLARQIAGFAVGVSRVGAAADLAEVVARSAPLWLCSTPSLSLPAPDGERTCSICRTDC